MIKVIILNGVARCGKDTFADAISGYGTCNGYDISCLSTVDEVKKISKYFGVGTDKTDRERKLWSDLKDAWIEYNDGPFNDIVTKISYLYNGKSSRSMYIIMCREPDEIEKFKNYYGSDCVTAIIRRQGIDIPNNHADENIENYNYDYNIYNSGSIRDLQDAAETLVDEIWK
jgi:hypothetical protein